MPPRINGSPVALAADLALSQQVRSAAPFARSFSSTQYREKMSRARQQMYQWLKSRDGQELSEGGRGPRYLGPFQDQPFPQNPLYRSQPVLDEQTRELIWEKITKRGESLKAISAEMGVDVRRVAAVVRLKEVEKQWVTDVSGDFLPFLLFACMPNLNDECDMMRHYKIFRLVLKTIPVVINLVFLNTINFSPYFFAEYHYGETLLTATTGQQTSHSICKSSHEYAPQDLIP